MKRMITTLIALMMISCFCLTGCQKQEQVPTENQTTTAQSQDATTAKAEEKTLEGKVDYGTSKIFSNEDIDAALNVVAEEAGMWDEITVDNIRYAGDEWSTDENLKKMNELGGGKKFTQVCKILTDVKVADDAPGGVWEAGKTYKDYCWWLAREDGGQWSLMTWGLN